MEKYDVIVIGSGSGMQIVENSVHSGLKTALVDKGPAGGTCLNVGCIPSKLLIGAADRVREIEESKKLGIDANINSVDFKSIIQYARDYVYPISEELHESWQKAKEFDYYEGSGEFVSDYTIKVNNKRIKGEKIFIVSGSRPRIPDIEGLEEVKYLTNDNVLELEKLPESMIIIGGGYIAAEYAHFFSAMGTDVTIVHHSGTMVKNEEPEISELLYNELSRRMDILLNTKPMKVKNKKNYAELETDKNTLKAEQIMVAAGRISNADFLKVENTGLEKDEKGFIKTNNYRETSKPNIWCFGDANGKAMFTHAANEEASLAWHNAMQHKHEFDYSAVPHAVFSWPQIASVGLTEQEAKKDFNVVTGRADYNEVVKGSALREDRGFAKGIFERETGKILGFHIIGPIAPVLIQEVANAMQADKSINLIAGMHIHPAMSEIITKVLGNIA